MTLNFERYYPHGLAIIAGSLWWYFSPRFPSDEKEFLAAALSFAAVLAGFTATAQAILMSLPSDSVMGRLRATGYVNELIAYIGASLHSSILFCLLNILGFFVLDSTQKLSRSYTTIWIVVGVFLILAFLRVTRIMLKIMRK